MLLALGGALAASVGLLIVTLLPMPAVTAVTAEWASIAICGAIVLGAAAGYLGAIGRVLGSKPMVYIGTISYGLYVLHLLVPTFAQIIEQRYDIWLRFPDFGWQRFLVTRAVAASAYVPYLPEPKSAYRVRQPNGMASSG